MNKKFFTLIAGALMLVASLGTANALDNGTPATKMDTVAQKGMYHLKAVRQGAQGVPLVVSVDRNGILRIADYATYPTGSVANALWCISVKGEEEGANPRFDFVNRAIGGELAVDLEDYTGNARIDIAQGDNKGWKFSATYATSLQQNRPLITYSEADKVLVLTYDGTSGNVGVEERTATATGDYSGDDVLLFTVVKPVEQYLTAADYNTRFQTEPNNDSIKLVFNPDRNSPRVLNPWTDYALRAVHFNDGNTPENALNFRRADGKYLRVDTAWTNATGVKFLAFAWGDITETDIEQPVGGHTSIRNQYNFHVRYDFTNDQLDIRVQEAYMKDPNAAANARWAASATLVTDPSLLRVKLQDLDDRRLVTIGAAPINTKILFKLGSCTASSPNFTSLGNDLYLISRTTAAGRQYLAVPVYTFYDDRDTVPQWISLQDNVDPKKMPAYQWVVEKTRTNNTGTAPVKITNREFPKVASKTSVQFYTDKGTAVKLLGCRNNGQTFDALDVSLSVANFGKPLDGSIKKNATLGYFYIDSLTAQTYTYEFNYLHKYKDDDYLSVKSDRDSSLIVSEGKSMFKLDLINISGGRYIYDEVHVEKYGYHTDKVDSLAQLKRVRYAIRIPGGSGLLSSATDSRYIVVDKEDRYAVSSYDTRVMSTPGGNFNFEVYGIFYLKTNNTKDNTDYYALLDMRNGTNYHVSGQWPQFNTRFVKVGIDDNSLWAFKQSPDETRTSAFAINKYTEPLYRRFDGEEYGKKPVKEPFGDKTNAPVWLKFTKYNNLGNEFLFENSPRGVGNNYKGVDATRPATTENDYRQGINDKSISFLGLYNINQFEERGKDFSYSFYVDTAYVRGETPMPQYMLAVRPEFVTGDTIFKISKDSVWDSAGRELLYETSKIDTIVRPSFTRAFWVFNAQDSVGVGYNNYAPHNADYQGKFAYGAENTTRLAFVDGIHYGDTFYVVRGQVATSQIDSVFFWNIPVRDKHYLGANTHYDPRWYQDEWTYEWNGSRQQYVRKANVPDFNLDRNGKSMVFQFRLVDPANDRRFLIESQREMRYNQDGSTYAASEIAPMWGKWLKIQNGIPVISEYIGVVEARQNGAEIFDVTKGEEKSAVANEKKPTVSSSVQVLGGTGTVTILNAGGKNVAISNILGQTVARQAVSSDNVTIALPKGIVVVAVEGEAAVKAIVK
ncbi:MAG: DUF6383 domain-containing protein [Tannerellaceae bacterium]|jgi:hypothetical protein|nr:DUF6383 domain-containing protein [Tannerellaceae bacterium]